MKTNQIDQDEIKNQSEKILRLIAELNSTLDLYSNNVIESDVSSS